MPTGTGTLRYFILGLLTHQPISGYDIKRILKSLDWLVGSPSFGAIYPALHALLRDDLVTVEALSFPGKPPRKIYSITERGRQAQQEWINRPLKPHVSLKTFVMRLMLADDFSVPRLVDHLEQRRAQVTAHHVDLARLVDELREKADQGRRLALDYGMAIASAELAWLDSVLDRLTVEPLPKPPDMESARVAEAV